MLQILVIGGFIGFGLQFRGQRKMKAAKTEPDPVMRDARIADAKRAERIGRSIGIFFFAALLLFQLSRLL